MYRWNKPLQEACIPDIPPFAIFRCQADCEDGVASGEPAIKLEDQTLNTTILESGDQVPSHIGDLHAALEAANLQLDEETLRSLQQLIEAQSSNSADVPSSQVSKKAVYLII